MSQNTRHSPSKPSADLAERIFAKALDAIERDIGSRNAQTRDRAIDHFLRLLAVLDAAERADSAKSPRLRLETIAVLLEIAQDPKTGPGRRARIRDEFLAYAYPQEWVGLPAMRALVDFERNARKRASRG